MKIKLLTNIDKDGIKLIKDSILDVDEKTSAEMIESKSAEAYVEEVEKEQIKQEIVKMTEKTEEKKVEVVKIKDSPQKKFIDGIRSLATGEIKEITLKAPTGQDESSGADGQYLVYQGMDTLKGALMADSVIWGKCERITSFGPSEYGRFIPYRDESTLNTTSAPRVYAPGEGGTKTSTKMAFNRHDLKLGLDSCVVYLTDEILADVGYIEQYIISSMRGKLGWQADYNILKGTYSAAVQGCIGVFDAGAANFYVEPVAHNATYTGNIINQIIHGVDPRLRAGAEWYMSNNMHATLVGQLGQGTTLSTQPLFSNNNNTLAGYPVNIMTQMSAFGSAGDILFGNFARGYTVAQKGEITLAKSKDFAFLTDEVVLRATFRYMGAPTYRKYAGVDAVEVAAFSSTSGTV